MVTETDLWKTAWTIAEQYGAEGVGFAAEMAHSFKLGEKTSDQQVWLLVMQKVEDGIVYIDTEGVAPPLPLRRARPVFNLYGLAGRKARCEGDQGLHPRTQRGAHGEAGAGDPFYLRP